MSSSTAIFLPQTAIHFFPTYSSSSASQLKSVKPFSVHQFPISNPVSSVVHVFGGGLSRKARTSSPCTVMSMNDPSSRPSDFRDDEGGSAVFEQEALLAGSADFRSGFTAKGLEATLNRQSKWIVAGLFVAIIVCRHDTQALWFSMGSVINVIVSVKLKQILKQERPVSNLRSDHGMPSSHAQSIFFNFTFAVIYFLEWLGINGVTLLISVSAMAFASYLSWLRVSQKLHTVNQIVVGAVLGFIFSFSWNWLWSAVVMEAFVSFLWARVLVYLSSAGFSIGFLAYLARYSHRGEL